MRYLRTLHDIFELWESYKRQICRTVLIREESVRMLGRAKTRDKENVNRVERDSVRYAKDKLSMVSLAKWKSFLEHVRFRTWSMLPSMYRLFTFEHLPNLHLGTLKLLKETVIVYLPSDNILIKLGFTSRTRKSLIWGQKAEDSSCNAYLTAAETDGWDTKLRGSFL